MGLLDDLKQQAAQQGATGNEGLTSSAEEFYREHIKSRMLTAYKFLDQLVNQLTSMQLETRADYPFRPEGKPVTLSQQDYKVFSDSIPEPQQITFTFYCKLVNPTTFDVNGRGAVLAQSELLDRYQFKYEKVEQKDPRQMVIGAKFRLQGPLPIKLVLQFDESKRVIKMLLSNFAGPGTSQYHLKPEQLNEAFLDRLGKYILRKESTLFNQGLSADVKAMLRKKLQEEQQQREAELQQAEEVAKAEEALRKQNSTTAQLKKAVSQTMNKNTEKLKQTMNEQLGEKTEKLKSMFGRIKSQIAQKKS